MRETERERESASMAGVLRYKGELSGRQSDDNDNDDDDDMDKMTRVGGSQGLQRKWEAKNHFLRV